MTPKHTRYLRLFVCLLLAGILTATGGDDISAKKKRSSRKARTTKVRKSRRSKKNRRSALPSLPTIVLGSTDPIDPPEPFVTLPQASEAPDGLEGATIALWPSHGKYYSGAWLWQRPRLFGTVEDLLSRAFIDPYITPMLENAGAYVMMPRERDFSYTALIVDNNGSNGDGRFATRSGRYKWEALSDSTGYGYRNNYIIQGENPFLAGNAGTVKTVEPDDSRNYSTAQWYGTITEAGNRAVYVTYKSFPNSATDAVYTVNHLGGSSEVTVNQQMGGGTWVYIGTYPFSNHADDKPLITLSNISADKDAVVSADAVKIGGGMGIVARSRRGSTPRVSGCPAYLEGARYYLQSTGFPEEVYSDTKGDNDYTDDYKARAHWVNMLSGGSEVLPDSAGLKVPIDLVLAFHTDAGVKTDSTTVGTLGLYSTDDGSPLGNGTSRYANRDLTSAVTSQVVNDIRALYNPEWSSRGNLDRRYYEIRATKVPAMIIELLSHQNFEDMKHALDPEFRFIVGRAVYKGILKFLAERYDRQYVVQPLPVEAFAIRADGDGNYTLSWSPVNDPIEPTATPASYIIYESTSGNGFHPVATTDATSWKTSINDDLLHAYYIVAANDGGVSFPSETLTLYDNRHRRPSVEIVNGYTRISGPQWTNGTDYAGFDFENNFGVPDERDIHYIGAQYDFDPCSKLSGGNLGFGASRDTESANIRIGNTRDYPIIHGEALRKAGRGFISSSLKAFIQNPSSCKATDLILGLQKTTCKAGRQEPLFQTFPKGLRDRLTACRKEGKALLVSGSYLASDIIENDSVTRDSLTRFATDILGYRPFSEGVNDSLPKVPTATRSLTVKGVEVMPGMPILRRTTLESFSTSSRIGADNPQSVIPADINGLVIARYDDTGYPAAIAVEGNGNGKSDGAKYAGRVILASFPIEAIAETDAREDFIAGSISYLIGAEPTESELSAPPVKSHTDSKSKKDKKKDKKDKKKKKDKNASIKKGNDATQVKDSKKNAVPKPTKKEKPSPRAVPHRRK